MTKYPVGGPRQPVYDLMRSLGFKQSTYSDKVWSRDDGLQVSIFGAGSMAHVSGAGNAFDCPLDQLSDKLNAHP